MMTGCRCQPIPVWHWILLVKQLEELDQQVDAIERELAQIHKVDPVAKSLSSIPGVCPITATALIATAPDPTMFSAGREFAAWARPDA